MTGKAIYKNVLAKTQKECKEKLDRAIEKNGKVDVIRSGKYTVAEWVRLWFETYSKPSIREQTAYYYNNYIEKHIVPGIGDIKLDKLTTIQIQQFYNKLKTSGRVQRYEHIELKDKGLSNRFIRGVHSLLNSALEQAVRERLITANPAEGCKLPKIEKKEMKVLLPEQIGSYLQEANRRGLLPAYYLELTSGLRRGELLALLWTDLDVENMTISVTKQVNRINGQLKVSQPKTSNSIRTIPIPKQAVDLLILEHEKHPDSPYMFPSPKTGTMYDPDSFRHTHEKILAAHSREDPCGGRDRAHPLPRSTSYLRHLVVAERCRCENPLEHPGPLQRRVHAGYLHPRHPADEAGGGGHHRERDRSGNVN